VKEFQQIADPYKKPNAAERLDAGNISCTTCSRRHAMKIFGVLLLIVGLIAAIASIAGLGQSADSGNPVAIVGDQNEPARDQATSLLLPIMAGIAIAAGGVLIGIGMGRFENPKVVSADSPRAHEAATTTKDVKQ
jgi:hypothetical protein